METVTESPTKSAPPETQEAVTLLAQGKRHLLVKDIHEAVSCLAKASELLAAHYGERANECGDAYLFYGRALLDLARSETGVLGDALGDEDAKESSEEEEDEEESVANGNVEEEEKDPENGEAESEEKEEVENGKEEEVSGEAKTSDSEVKATETKESAAEPSTAEAGTSSAGESTKKAENDEEEEDDSNLKLAWEMLELAKLIFQRQQDNKQSALKLADVYMLLGEVSLESEMYGEAIEDMKRCLEIQLQHLEPDDRRITESHYQLGTAFSLNNQFNESVEEYTKSVELIELKIKNLEAKLASGDKPDKSDAFYTVEGEISELNELLPEIKEKVIEMKEVKIQTLNVMSKVIEEGTGSSEEKNTSSKAAEAGVSKPVFDISHLVRKKRKVDEVETADAAPVAAPVAAPEAAPASAVATEDGKGTKRPDGEQPAKMRKAE